jgi:hypothetical protein
MAHITLQTGMAHKEKDCPNLRCVFDAGAALSTANFHFMEAVVRQFAHILKRIYMPAEYATIVVSGIVTYSNDEPITTELPVGFEIHLPYHTLPRTEARHPSSLPLAPMLLPISSLVYPSSKQLG